MAKQKVSELTKKEEEKNKRAEEFKNEVIKLQEKYNVKLYAILEYKVNGIIPSISIQDVKDKKDNGTG